MENKRKIIFAYRVKVDEGKAPCVEDGMLSLAICKRELRNIIAKQQKERKDVDFYLLGLNGSSIVFYAKLDSPMLAAEYYEKYKTRKDSLYSLNRQGQLVRNNRYACIHTSEHSHNDDIGGIQHVLISHDFTYCGKKAVSLGVLRNKYEGSSFIPQKQGHRPGNPYEAKAEYEIFHREIESLLAYSDFDMVSSMIPFPPESGCNCENYAKELASIYKRQSTIKKHTDNKIKEVKGYCVHCDNAKENVI